MEDFKNLIKQKENGGRKGFDSKSKTWKPHKSAEGGTDTIGWGHKLTAAEQAGGYVIIGEEKVPFAQLTEDKNNILFEQDWARKSQDAAKFINEKGDWNSLTEPQKLVSTELFYNLGNKATQYKNFRDKILTPNSNFIEEIDRSYTDTKGKKRSLTERTDPIKAWYKEQGKAPGVNSYEQYMQAAENENAALMPTYGAPKVAAAPAVSPNFKVAGGYNPNKAPENVMSQYGKGPREVIKETETITEEGPGFIDRIKSGFEELYPFNEGGPVEEQTTTTETIDVLPSDNYYKNYMMQEAARRSMMQGNEEERMADYEGAKYNPQQNSSYALPQMQAAQRMMGGYAQGGTVNQAQGLASLGRGGDSTLVHMQPQEVAGLQQLAQSNGTSLTRNPMTGYPEAFSLGGVLKAAAPIAVGAMMPGLGSAIAAGALTGGTIAAVSGDDVLAGTVSGGMGGASGSGFGEAMGMGLDTAAVAAPGNAVPYASLATPVANTGINTGINAGGNLLTAGGRGTSLTGSIGTPTSNINPALTASKGQPIKPYTPNITPKDLAVRADGKAGELSFKNFFDNPSKSLGNAQQNLGTYGIEKQIDPFTKMVTSEKEIFTPAGKMETIAKLGSPVTSLGLGGLEASDFINEPDFNDPRDKYNPYSKLNLSNDTGISEAMSRDTGLRLLARGGYLQGPGDGMSDDIPATINGDEPAALADGEFVVPADVVSHLGNGSSEAGSKQLYAMMDRIRKARTGRESQGKEIKPGKYMPR